MSVLPSDIVAYGSANMQDTDSGTQGGAISTAKRLVFEDIAPSGNIEVVSSSASDTTQTVTTTGRDAGGNIISEGKVLTGVTPVAMTVETTWERFLKAIKSATSVGDVAVMAVTNQATGTAQGGAAQTTSAMANIQLAAAAVSSDGEFDNFVIRITGGTGANQIRRIINTINATDTVEVNEDWDVLVDATSVYEIAEGVVFEKGPNEVTEIRRPFYDAQAEAPGGSARDYYEKIFLRNNHATLALTNATVAEQADPSGNIDFGLPATLGDTATSTDRRTAPGGITFNNTTKNVANSQSHTALAAQGVWIHLNLPAGAAAAKSSYTLRESGNTV